MKVLIRIPDHCSSWKLQYVPPHFHFPTQLFRPSNHQPYRLPCSSSEDTPSSNFRLIRYHPIDPQHFLRTGYSVCILRLRLPESQYSPPKIAGTSENIGRIDPMLPPTTYDIRDQHLLRRRGGTDSSIPSYHSPPQKASLRLPTPHRIHLDLVSALSFHPSRPGESMLSTTPGTIRCWNVTLGVPRSYRRAEDPSCKIDSGLQV